MFRSNIDKISQVIINRSNGNKSKQCSIQTKQKQVLFHSNETEASIVILKRNKNEFCSIQTLIRPTGSLSTVQTKHHQANVPFKH